MAGDRESRIAILRARMEALESTSGHTERAGDGASRLAIPGPVGELLPGGGVARRQVTELNDCPPLAVELATRVTAAGGFVAVVGWAELALAQVAEEGQLGRIIAVPDPGAQPWSVTGVLVEGMDLVIHHGQPVDLTPTKARPVLAKLRAGRAALLTVGPHVPGTALRLEGEVVTYRGIGRGTGRIRGMDIEVRVRGKAHERVGTVTVGQARRLERA